VYYTAHAAKTTKMIGYINGLIIDKNKKSILVLTNGIGYNVNVTADFLAECKPDTKAQLYIHTAVREDGISLYGFSKKEELDFFEQLISVSGIGPKIGLDILATPLRITQSAIVNEDAGLLTKIKGIGKKTAERIILELKNKITPVSGKSGEKTVSTINEDAVMALESLGYERFQIIKAMADLPKNIKQTEDIVKYFLKNT
jgi:holliday junction DNA helicase RuvA